MANVGEPGGIEFGVRVFDEGGFLFIKQDAVFAAVEGIQGIDMDLGHLLASGERACQDGSDAVRDIELDGDTLKFTAIPPRAKFPVKVTVLAWQYGRSGDPKLKSQEPVERTFSITHP